MSAGLGIRLRPLTYGVPKPLVPVLNQPAIFYPLNLLKSSGIKEVAINLYHHKEKMKSVLRREKLGLKIVYSEEKTLLGTAGGVKKMEKFLGEETFLVLSSDGICKINLQEVVKYHRTKGGICTIVLKLWEGRFRYGVGILDREGRIEKFVEKPNLGKFFSAFVNTGIYVFEPAIFKYIPSEKEYDFSKNVFPSLLKAGEKIYGYVTQEFWIDIGNVEDYRKANQELLKKEGGVKVGKGAWVSPQAKVISPSFIGKKVWIEKGAHIGEFSILGEGVRVEKKARLTQCIVWKGAKIGEGASLSGCVVGERVEVPPRVRVAGGIFVEGTI